MGTITVGGQAATFAAAFLFGVGYCLLYDLFRLLHRRFPGKLAVFISDLFYWFIVFLCSASFQIVTTKGRLRGYVVAGYLLGFVAARLLLSPIVLRLLPLLFFPICRILHDVCRFVDGILAFFDRILTKCETFFEKVPEIRKKHLKRQGKVVYNQGKYKKRSRYRESQKKKYPLSHCRFPFHRFPARQSRVLSGAAGQPQEPTCRE